jgi:cell division septation protein DedD
MSRLDIITVVIVVLCVVALGYLIYKTTNLLGNKPDTPPVTEVVEPRSNEPEPWTFDGTAPGDSATAGVPAAQEDSYATPAATTQPVSAPVYDLDKGTGGDFMVIAGSFSLAANAEARVKSLRDKGYADAAVGYFNKKSYASAIAGRFDNMADAQQLVTELKTKHGVDAYVQKKVEK